MLRPGDDTPAFSPGPWMRGMLYTLFALGALWFGDYTGDRPMTPMKWLGLGAIAVIAGVLIALLQIWARHAASNDPSQR